MLSLDLSDCTALTSACLEQLLREPNMPLAMSTLSISRSGLGEAALLAVAECCPRLTSLEATNVSLITDSAVTAVVQRCPSLKLLQADGPLLSSSVAQMITDGQFKMLACRPPVLAKPAVDTNHMNA